MSVGVSDVVRDLRRRATDDVAELSARGASSDATISAELNRVWEAIEHIARVVDAR